MPWEPLKFDQCHCGGYESEEWNDWFLETHVDHSWINVIVIHYDVTGSCDIYRFWPGVLPPGTSGQEQRDYLQGLMSFIRDGEEMESL